MEAIAELLGSSPGMFAATAALFGLAVGSFLNVVIYRLPIMLEREWQADCAALTGTGTEADAEPFNLTQPRSRCPQCAHPIGATENLPLLSYALQRGRCRHCGARISARYPLIEATTALLSAVVAWHYGWGWEALGALIVTWSLVPLAAIDLEHQLLPDRITLPLLWLGLAQALWLGTPEQLQERVAGAIVGYLALWSIFHLFRLLTGKHGMGHGDFKLLAMLGAWLGWQHLLGIVLLSSVVGAVVGIALIALRGRDRQLPMPFGPFLAVAGWIQMLWGSAINQAWLGWAGGY